MLERFKIPDKDQVRVPHQPLRRTVAGIFEKMRVPPRDAHLAADVLVSADLRGVDSHGVSNQLRRYLEDYNSGHINPRPKVRIVRETPSTANMDSDSGIGLVATPHAMEIAIKKARVTGIGMVTIFNGRHIGMAAYHAMLALDHDMIGICMTSTRPTVLPTFGSEPRLGTNPIAIAAPARAEPPFVLDMATSAVASNKFVLAQRLGINVPPGWVSDQHGTPIMEPGPLPETYYGLPLGGTRDIGSHKGYGLACVVDILCGLLSGGGFSMTSGARGNYSHMVAAYSIAAFTDVPSFKDMMDDFLRTLRSTPPAPGQERVLYPGLPEFEAEQDRRANGIPLHREVVQWLKDTCAELGIPFLTR